MGTVRSNLRRFLAAMALLGSATAQASFIGDTVNCSITPTPFWVCTTPSAVVGAGVEFELELPSASASFGFDVDIGASSIRIASNEDNTFGLGANELLTLSSLDWLPGGSIVGITNFAFGGVTLMDPSRVTFTGDSITINIDSGSVWSVGSFVSFDVVVAERVPEPGSALLVGLGLAGIGLVRKRARRS